MAGGTHVFDMIKRLRDNDNLRKKRYFQKQKGMISSEPLQDHVQVTGEERKAIERSTREAQRREARRSLIILTGIVILVLVTLLALLAWRS